MLRAALSAAVLASILAAQTQVNRTAHPNETLQNSSGNLVPFGVLSNGNFGEGHTQLLLRSVELPGPGAVLVGMEVHCQNVAAINYLSLQITVSPTTATALNPTFASNLVAPVVVLQATNLAVAYPGNAWVPIAFTVPYVHDGISSLVIDIEKSVDPLTIPFATMSTTSNPARNDLPPMIYAFGTTGSGQASAPVATTRAQPLLTRLQWGNAPTLRLRSDRFNNNGNQFAIGGSITHTVSGTPGSLFIDLIAQSFLPPGATLPPVIGEFRVNGATLGVGLLDATGTAQFTLNVPANTNLVGQYYTWQSGTLDALSGLPQFTNAIDNFLNNPQ